MKLTIGFTRGSLNALKRATAAKIKEKEKELAKEVLATSLDIEREAKEDAPVLYGRLRASIHTKTHGVSSHNYTDNTGQGFKAELIERVETPLTALVGTDVVYAKVQEYNSPFLFPAAQNNKAPFNKRVAKIMKEK